MKFQLFFIYVKAHFSVREEQTTPHTEKLKNGKQPFCFKKHFSKREFRIGTHRIRMLLNLFT